MPNKILGYQTDTGARISEHDYEFLSDGEKEKCIPVLSSIVEIPLNKSNKPNMSVSTKPYFSLQEIDDYEKWMKDIFTELTEFERMKLAIEVQRNRMMADIFVLSESAPSALEAIAMALSKTKLR